MWGAIFQKLRSPNSGRPERRAGPAHLFAEDAKGKAALATSPLQVLGKRQGPALRPKTPPFPPTPGSPKRLFLVQFRFGSRPSSLSL